MRKWHRDGGAAALCLFLICGVFTPGARAAVDAGWFEVGDNALRLDLQLLNDAGVIRLPVTQWPIPRAAVIYALQGAKEHFAGNAAVARALARVKVRIDPHGENGGSRGLTADARVSAGEAGRLRDFDAPAREDGELGARVGLDMGRAAVSLNVTAVASPKDEQDIRLDGSHATVALGNWLVSAHTLDRFWGPSHESSLILSNNARPMPTLMLERAAAKPFESALLSWLGPWRFSLGFSQMEDHRADIDAPLFMAWRVTIMPFHDMELGFSRTAQFCGKQLECNLDVFGNMLAGNDNVGIDATPENEPGNQMAGFDLRWNSPIGTFPYAIYSQMIGEDESSYLPAKYLAQFGVEVWKPMASGSFLQAFAEYADTSCSATTPRPRLLCAYNQGRFNMEGYRYRGRVIGHTTDRDSRTYSLGANLIRENGDAWSLTLRDARLNRGTLSDDRDTVTPIEAEYSSVEAGWRGKFFGEEVSADLGVESYRPKGGERQVDPYGFIGWRHAFQP